MLIRFLKWLFLIPSGKARRTVKVTGAPTIEQQGKADEALRAMEYELYTHEGIPQIPARWDWE